MCGISGIIGENAARYESQLHAMIAIQSHRGPDGEGAYVEKDALLGHNRLAILDLSEAGLQPMHSTEERFTIVFNGEIFNYKEIKNEIGSRYSFRTQTDTEVLIAAYTVWGKQCLSKLKGMFAFAIWDKKEQQLFCARDQFGIKPFHYSLNEGCFLFSSEIKALLAAGITAAPNYSVLYDYLNWGVYDYNEHTFFEGIKRLKPGHYLIWKDGEHSIHKYWDINSPSLLSISDEEAADRVYDIIEKSVAMSLRSDVPIGINLSGGLDSAALAYLIDSKFTSAEQHLEAFTQDYRELDFSERPWVMDIAQQTKRTVHFSLMTDSDFQQIHDGLVWHQDEPYAGVTVAGFVGMYQQATKRNVTVLLDGNGVDECLCGYRQYHNAFLKDLAQKQDKDVDAYISAYAREWGVSPSEAKQIAYQHSFNDLSSAKDGYKTVSPCASDEFLRTYKHDYPDYEKPFESPVKNMMYRDMRYFKIPRSLRFNDRISMAFSKELRVPFLDTELFELAFQLPEKQLFASMRPKGILRNRLNGLVSDNIRLAPKRHIQSPQSSWFSTSLEKWIQERIHDASLNERHLFDSGKLRAALTDLKNGSIQNSFFVMQLLNIETWFKTYIDAPLKPSNPDHFPKIMQESMSFSS